MPDWIRILLNMLSQFTGGRGGIDHVIVNYGIAAMFYAIMFAVVKIKYRDDPQPREHLLVWAFAIATARELFMIIMAVIQALGMVTPTKLHAVFPPFEHLLLGLALVLIAAAFLRYLLDDAALTRRYLQLGMGACVLSYAVTSWQWANTLAANPAIVFGPRCTRSASHHNDFHQLIIRKC